MTTIIKDPRALADALIEPGDIFWGRNQVLENSVFHFTKGFLHPVVVTEVHGKEAEVRVMTTRISGNRRNGILYTPGPQVKLDGPGVILTRRRYRQRIPVSALRWSNYLGNIGLPVLTAIWASEWLLDWRNGSSR